MLRKNRLPLQQQDLFGTLFLDEDYVNTYALIDGARVVDLFNQLNAFSPPHACLYRGQIQPDLARAAPYLVKIEREHSFTNWFIKEHWGSSGGLFLLSEADLSTVYKHFRQFLVVKDSDGEKLYFRFYDPRVLRVFLPTCNDEELEAFFGAVDEYIVEDDDANFALSFTMESLTRITFAPED